MLSTVHTADKCYPVEHDCFGYLGQYYCSDGFLYLDPCSWGHAYEAESYKSSDTINIPLEDLVSISYDFDDEEAFKMFAEMIGKTCFSKIAEFDIENKSVSCSLSNSIDVVITIMRMAHRYNSYIDSVRFEYMIENGVPRKSALFSSMLFYYRSYLGNNQSFVAEQDSEEFIHDPYYWNFESIVAMLTGEEITGNQDTVAEEKGYKREHHMESGSMSTFLNLKDGESLLSIAGDGILAKDIKAVLEPIISVLG